MIQIACIHIYKIKFSKFHKLAKFWINLLKVAVTGETPNKNSIETFH